MSSTGRQTGERGGRPGSASLLSANADGHDLPGFVGTRSEKKGETLARQILVDAIDSGLEPGAMLPPEAAMLEHYRVGRTTLREALRILEVHGLLVIRAGPGGGPVLTAPSARNYARTSSLLYQAAGVQLHHALAARLVMEPIAVRLAAEHHTDESIARLQQVVADIEGCPLEDNRAFLRVSRTFHEVVNSISGNPILDLFSQALVDLFLERSGPVYPPDRRDHINHQHLAVARAILRGNGQLAGRLMREHMTEYSTYSWQGNRSQLNEIITWR